MGNWESNTKALRQEHTCQVAVKLGSRVAGADGTGEPGRREVPRDDGGQMVWGFEVTYRDTAFSFK